MHVASFVHSNGSSLFTIIHWPWSMNQGLPVLIRVIPINQYQVSVNYFCYHHWTIIKFNQVIDQPEIIQCLILQLPAFNTSCHMPWCHFDGKISHVPSMWKKDHPWYVPRNSQRCSFFHTCHGATTACTFSTSQLPKVVRPWCVLYILTWKCASRHNGVQFFIAPVASWLRTRRFSEPTFRPSGATNHWKNTVFRDFPTFSRICIFFLLTYSLLLFSLLIFLFSLPLPCSAFHLSILSEVWLLNFLRSNKWQCVTGQSPFTRRRSSVLTVCLFGRKFAAWETLQPECWSLHIPPVWFFTPGKERVFVRKIFGEVDLMNHYYTNLTSSTAQGGGGSFRIGNL